MENSSGIQVSLAGRYAKALFDLAQENGAVDAVAASLANVARALSESPDFGRLTTNPLVSRKDAAKAVAGIAGAINADPLSAKFLGTLAQNRRLDQLAPAIRAFNALLADHRGQATAEVTSAHPLTDDQLAALQARLKSQLGRDITLNTSIDPALLGGLVVKVGSQMIDGSIRTKLNTLATAMKG